MKTILTKNKSTCFTTKTGKKTKPRNRHGFRGLCSLVSNCRENLYAFNIFDSKMLKRSDSFPKHQIRDESENEDLTD